MPSNRNRDEAATIRVSNLPEDIRESDLQVCLATGDYSLETQVRFVNYISASEIVGPFLRFEFSPKLSHIFLNFREIW